MDVSKQGFSAGFLHLYNILASRALSESDDDGSNNQQCDWYFVNFTCDIFGIALFSYLFIKLFNYIMRSRGYEEITMGNYQVQVIENPDSPDGARVYIITPEAKKRWLYQLGIWLAIVTLVSVIL
jgi:STIMATE family